MKPEEEVIISPEKIMKSQKRENCKDYEEILCQHGYELRGKLKDNSTEETEFSGTTLGIVQNANLTYGMDKFNTPRGHGFAAERANHLHDILKGETAEIVGDNNLKNGADRIVNGQSIQTKFCNTGSKCVSECFDSNQNFKYKLADGQPMQIEVPKDKYSDAVKAMEDRIRKGQVEGVTDPSKAKDIIKDSPFTYEQVKNIAKFGTVESLTFDAINGTIISVQAMGISALVSFAVATWNGKDISEALEDAVQVGLKTGGITFVSSILSSQLARTGLNSSLRETTDFLVQKMGPKAAAQIANALRTGGNIYGAAAMNNVSKLLRGNLVTGAITVVVLSGMDVVNIFRGRISGGQLIKNVTNTASGVAGGMGGWAVGASAGAAIGSVIPVIGTAICGFIGGLGGAFFGGSAATSASSAVLDELIEDDSKEMIQIIERSFSDLAVDYMLNQKEAEEISDNLKDKIDSGSLKDMYASLDRREFARKLLIEPIERVVRERKYIKVPEDDLIIQSLRKLMESSEEYEEIQI